MTKARDCVADESGMILVSVLLILSLLVAVAVGSISSVHNDYRMVNNLRGGTAALYLAESGVEWAKEQIGAATSLPLAVTDRVLSLSTGTFATVFSGSAQPTALTGQIVVRATGNAGSAAQTVEARITKHYDLADGAVVLRGEARSLNFIGSNFVFDGRDHELASRAVLTDNKPRLALTAGSNGLLAQLNGALSEVQVNNFVGQENGRNALGRSQWLAGDVIGQLVNGACSAPSAHTIVIPALTNLMLPAGAFGSRTAPEVRCFDGSVDSSSAVTVAAGISGAGLLIVRNAELVLSSHLSWEGVVIITGRNIGLRVVGADAKEITGALMINETGSLLGSGPGMLDIQGSFRVLFSRHGQELAATLFPNLYLQNAYSQLPYRLMQDYWRMVSP